eukprot:TRINITY_DN32215_c0_g1_i1.p1 TRINITY_DN32215_c0_g1~~TRINITY_DN32215_c0_g1_i1.p1  ORF type:complete len:447 (+),score=40.60 TRINITY_DN32215_c0_g1_i1:77-1417(+)
MPLRSWLRIWQLWLLGQMACQCVCKQISGTVQLGGDEEADHWKYVSKFGYAIGSGTFKFRLRLRERSAMQAQNESATVDMDLYLDEDWDAVLSSGPCSRGRDSEGSITGLAKQARRLEMPYESSEWTEWYGGKVRQSIRTHVWLFALSSCIDRAARYTVDYEFIMLQFDGSEFSFELRYMLPVHVIVLVVLLGFLLRFCMRWLSFRKMTGTTHPVIGVLAVAVTLQWTAQALHTIHLLRYRMDGRGAVTGEIFAEVCFQLSQVMSATLLIAIGQGYTLLDMTSKKRAAAVVPTAIVVGVVHIGVVLLAKLEGEESSDKYHAHEGLVGWVLVGIRLCLYVWFQLGSSSLRSRAGMKLESFLQSFSLLGSLYFLAHPVLFLIVHAFAPYLRHPVLQIGLLSVQTTAVFCLADLFLNCRSIYHELSELGASALPGGMTNSPITTSMKHD